MKRTAVVLVLCAALTACGTKRASSDAQHVTSAVTPAQKAQAKKIVDACMKKGGSFKAEAKCAVPPGHGTAFVRCAIDNAPKTRTQAAIETDLINCGERFR